MHKKLPLIALEPEDWTDRFIETSLKITNKCSLLLKMGPISCVEMSKKLPLIALEPQDWTDKLYRNVGKNYP